MAGIDVMALPPIPGWDPPDRSSGRMTTFGPQDAAGRWVLDFHMPRGPVPLAWALVDDIVAGAQGATRALGLPGQGLQARLAGCHAYLGLAPVEEAATSAAGQRADARSAAESGGTGVLLPPSAEPGGTGVLLPPEAAVGEIRAYQDAWAAAAARLEEDLDGLDAVDLSALSDAALAEHHKRAAAVHAGAWRLHFDVMYRLFAVHERYLSDCARHGIDAVTATRMVEGRRSAIGDTDRAIRDLADLARAAGLSEVLLHSPSTRVLAVLRERDEAGPLLAALADVVARHGRRSSSLCDLEGAAWSEDPAPVLALVRSALLAPPRHGWDEADATRLVGVTLAALPAESRPEVAAAWERGWAAAAPWWNEEHNALIDLRIHLPIRDVAREAARRWGVPLEEVLHATTEEFLGLLAGRLAWADVRGIAGERIAAVRRCRGRRLDLPGAVGTGEGVADDVVVRQIMGGAAHPWVPHEDVVLEGLAVSPGVGRGTVRVVRHPDDIGLLQLGDVLVCEATSPSWTPAFDRLAGAVCDGGGLLTHAAIISREYGVPCVCATFSATTTLRDGDVVEVDGTNGTVRLLHRARA